MTPLVGFGFSSAVESASPVLVSTGVAAVVSAIAPDVVAVLDLVVDKMEGSTGGVVSVVNAGPNEVLSLVVSAPICIRFKSLAIKEIS